MDILFIGAFSTKSIIAKYPNYGLDTYKTTEFLLKGFSQIESVNLQVITAPDVGSYPKLPQIVFRRIVEEGVVSIGFPNIKGLKRFFIIRGLYREAKKLLKGRSEKTYVIIPYMVAHYVRIARKIKKRFGDQVVICQIIPDIFFHNNKFSPTYWLNYYAEQSASKADVFVLFTKAMADYLGLDEKRCIVMESLIDGDAYLTDKKYHLDHRKTRILYTGALRYDNGVDKLINMLPLLKREDFELWITGRGAYSNVISGAAQSDSRIHFLGTVPKEDVFRYQSEADVLVNPRSDNNAPQETKYMFPSKLMEYMLTGNVVLTCRMSGIPEDYYNYVFVSEDDTPRGIAASLNKLLDLTQEERESMGMAARQYILENKTYSVQSNRIVTFLKKF